MITRFKIALSNFVLGALYFVRFSVLEAAFEGRLK